MYIYICKFIFIHTHMTIIFPKQKIAAKKRLEEKNKKKTEEENAMRKGEALQVCNSFNIFLNFKYFKISD